MKGRSCTCGGDRVNGHEGFCRTIDPHLYPRCEDCGQRHHPNHCRNTRIGSPAPRLTDPWEVTS